MSKRLLKDEQGMVMVVVIGIMLILTVLAFGIMFVSESDLTLSTRDQESMETLHIADAGIQKALWQLSEQGNTMQPRTFSINVGNGTAEVNAIQDAGRQWYWTIESTGTTGSIKRKIKVTVFNFSLWNMNMGLGNNSLAQGGNGILGNTSIDGPFYVRGNVELGGSSDITGGPLFIKTGTLVMDGASQLGEADKLIEAYIEPASGHEDIVDKHDKPLNPGDPNVYVSLLSNQVPNIKLPLLDPLSSYRQLAASESEETSTAYPGIIAVQSQLSGYKVLDNDEGNSTGDLASRNMYKIDNTVDSFGLEGDKEFGWDKINRRLYVDGTVFVDGNLTIGDDANDEVQYYGKGTLVVNGEIFIKGKLRPPWDAQAGTYDMNNSHVLGLVTAETIYIDTQGGNAQPTKDSPDISGAFFATKKVKFQTNNTSFVGSMIAGVLDFSDGTNNSHLFTHDNLPSFLPPSLPGDTKFLAMTTSWREVE